MKAKFLIVIGLGVSLYSCSVRKMDQEKRTEKTEINHQEETNISLDQKTEAEEITSTSKFDLSQWFTFDYRPIFDQNGQLIPFSLEHTKNGETEKITISGATINGGMQQQQQSASTKQTTVFINQLITTYQTKLTNKIHTTYQTKTKERYSIGPQSIYSILLIASSILLAISALTGHWSLIKNTFNKLLKFLGLKK